MNQLCVQLEHYDHHHIIIIVSVKFLVRFVPHERPGAEPAEGRPPGRGGGLTYAQGPHVRQGKKFPGRVQMYDGCCLRRPVKKKSLEN